MLNHCPFENTFRATQLSHYFDEIDYNMFDKADCIKQCFSFDSKGEHQENDIIPILPKYQDLIYIGFGNVIYIKEEGKDCLVETDASLDDDLWSDFVFNEQEDHDLNIPYGSYDPVGFYWKSDKDGKSRPLQSVSFYVEDNVEKENVLNKIEIFFQDLKNQGMINF